MSHPSLAAARDTAAVEWDLVEDTVRWSPGAYRVLARDPRLGPLTLDQLPSYLVAGDRPLLCRMVTGALVCGRPLDCVVRVDHGADRATAVHCTGRPGFGPDGHVVSLHMELTAVR